MKKTLTALIVASALLSGLIAGPASASVMSSSALKAEYTKKLNAATYQDALTKPKSSFDTSSESQLFKAVNSDRNRAGKKAITSSSALKTMARKWALKMATDNHFRHNPNLASQAPAGWLGIGENIAANGNASNSTGMVLHYQWMDSDSHRENVLNSLWTHGAVGVYIDRNGKHWGVQVFARYPAGQSPDLVNPTISGFSSGLTTLPNYTATWNNVKLSHTGYLQRYSGGKWTNVKRLARGTHKISLKASSSYGITHKYRIRIPAATGRSSAVSKTVALATKAKSRITGFTKVSSVKRSGTVRWKNVKLSHAGELQRFKGGKWTKVKALKSGTRDITAKAPSAAGSYKYRVIIKGTSKRLSSKSATITVRVR